MRAVLAILLIGALALGGCVADDDEDPGAGETTDENDGQNETLKPVHESVLGWSTGSCTPLAISGMARGIGYDEVAVEDTTWDLPFLAEFEIDGPHEYVEVKFATSEGAGVGSEQSTGDVLEGTVPEEARHALFTSCGGAEVLVTFTVWPEPVETSKG